MKNFSIKGITIGILVMLALSFVTNMLSAYYFVAIYNDVAPGVSITDESQIPDFTRKIMLHPLSIASIIIETIMVVGISGYVAAWIAGKSFIAHSMIIGIVSLSLMFIEYEILVQLPILTLLSALFTLFVAYSSGWMRQRHAAKLNP